MAAPTAEYGAFLASKRITSQPCGFDVSESDINPMLFDFQRRIVQWAVHRGRAAIFADCGLGKSAMQITWADIIVRHEDRPVLILAPLAVAQQTVQEGEKFGVTVTLCRAQADVRPGVNITNYEMLRHFDSSVFAGIVLDESSILKSYDGKLRKQITDFARSLPYRLACTATPAPNDLIEITNHAEFSRHHERQGNHRLVLCSGWQHDA